MKSRIPRRRALLALLGSTLVPWPAIARPSDRPRVVAYLSGGRGPEEFTQPLAALGFVQGSNLRFETRVRTEPDPILLARTAVELVALNPDALLAFSPRVQALAAATRTIPIVCGGVPDPVAAGFARSLQRPGGNVTGLSMGFPEALGVQLGLMRQLRPRLKRLAMVHPPGLPVARAFPEAARAADLEWIPIPVADAAGLASALASLSGEAVVIGPFFHDRELMARALELSIRHRVAAIGFAREGGLMSYGFEHTDPFGRVAAVLAKVLRGANPAEIPFQLPDRPFFALNRSTARAIGVEIPPEVLIRVTELID